ncbi:sensor histidine kinase [Pengzhenrongella sicca]|uniref:histidine kinase n=1 Tax=Pengzhenrongella sicca TaxID=2819238 RepID=A0A8A4ZEV5_9MICO|nr:HAMP domain-containing sensor histidine kinase [Pengzhenrongella sicca]QTE29835.1 HAMP domain-containing histidine kinase [Pengzhenrongella sicca]
MSVGPPPTPAGPGDPASPAASASPADLGEPVGPVGPVGQPIPPGPLTRAGRALASRLHAVPLRARMVGIITALLLLGLALASVTTLTLLNRSLIEQVDTQLETSAAQAAEQAWNGTSDRLSRADVDGRPSDYFVQIAGADGQVLGSFPAASATDGSSPALPVLTTDDVGTRAGEPFTVPSLDGKSRWRVIEGLASIDGLRGSVAVALPLTAMDATMIQMQQSLLGISVAVILLGALAGWLAVRRSLRPLREIEDTAAAIAAGDMSRRVPAAPTSTEVGRLAAALNAMLAQIEQAFAARAASEARMRRFVADASHELRTPLATIRGYSELYRMGAVTTKDEIDDTVQRIESSATRMGRLVEDLLHLARLDDGRPMRAEQVDLTVLVADAVSDLHALDVGRPIRLEPLVPGTPVARCVVVGDEDRLRQVLSNLTGNVAQHTPRGTAVEIAVGRTGEGAAERAVLEVRDHGPGISAEHAARVFERFYRVDFSRTRESGGGAGLGMAIVAAIVGAHRGSVEISETPGGGTTVRVTLPLDPAAPEPEPEDAEDEPDGADDGAADEDEPAANGGTRLA